MYTCVWEFMVTEGTERDFERIYASDGAWTELFKKSPDLKRLWHDDYLTLDGRCSCLIDAERLIGEIES
jgi:hypothetical protein